MHRNFPYLLSIYGSVKNKNCVIYSYKINLDLSILPSYMMRGEIVYLFIYMNSWSWGIQVQDVFVKNIRKCQLNYNNLDKRKRILSYDFIGRINKLLAISRSQWHSIQQFIIDRLLVFDLRQSISYWRSFRFGQEKQNILVSITTSVLFQGYFNPIYKLNSIFYIFNYLYCTTRNINISPKKKKTNIVSTI